MKCDLCQRNQARTHKLLCQQCCEAVRRVAWSIMRICQQGKITSDMVQVFGQPVSRAQIKKAANSY